MYDIVKERRGSGGLSGTSIFLGKIIGGNAMPLTSDDGSEIVFPNGKQISIPLEIFTDDGDIATIPSVDYWNELELDNTYQFGEDLKLLPNGISYVRLVRPFSVGSKSWSSYLSGGIQTNNTGDLIATRIITNDLFDKINVYFNYSNFKILDTTSPSSFRLNVTDLIGNDVSDNYNVSAIKKDDNKIVLSLNQAVNPNNQVIKLSFDVVCSVNTVSPALLNIVVDEEIVSYFGDKFSIIYGLNTIAEQQFESGTLVFLDKTAVSIADLSGTVQSCYKIMGPVSSAQYHDHRSYAADGLGRAGLDIMYGGVNTNE